MKTILNDVRVLKEEAQKAFESVANEFHNELYNRTPVDTGVAQKSWHIRVKNIQKFKFILLNLSLSSTSYLSSNT